MDSRIERVRALRAGALLLAVTAAAAPVLAQEAGPKKAGEQELKAEAKRHFEQAVADYDAARYEQALANFQEAYRLRPHPLVNVNIANCYDKLGKPLQAIHHFERFLEASAGSAAQRQEVNSALERLRKRVGQLLLRITPDGATVIIDQGEQRRAPILEPVRLEAGTHTIEVQLAGYRTSRRVVGVNGGATFELNIALEREGESPPVLAVTPSASKVEKPEPAPAPAPAAPPPATPAPSATPAATSELPAPEPLAAEADSAGMPTAAWVAGGITVALMVSATITGVLAISAESDFDEQRARLANARTPLERVAIYDQARDDADRADALALTTDILLGGVLAGVAVTAIVLLTSDGSGEQESAWIAPQGAGVRVGF